MYFIHASIITKNTISLRWYFRIRMGDDGRVSITEGKISARQQIASTTLSADFKTFTIRRKCWAHLSLQLRWYRMPSYTNCWENRTVLYHTQGSFHYREMQMSSLILPLCRWRQFPKLYIDREALWGNETVTHTEGWKTRVSTGERRTVGQRHNNE